MQFPTLEKAIAAKQTELKEANPNISLEAQILQLKAFAANESVSKDMPPEEFNRQMKEANPDYEPPRDRAYRFETRSHALMNYCESFIKMENPPHTQKVKGSNQRTWNALLSKDDSPETIAENDRIIHILNEGTKEEQHELFLNMMHSLAQVDLERIVSMSDREVAENYKELIIPLHLGHEAVGMTHFFDIELHCDLITQEEKDLLADIADPVSEAYGKVTAAMNRIMNPYYLDVDITQLTPDFQLVANGEKVEKGYAAGCVQPDENKLDLLYMTDILKNMDKLVTQIDPGKKNDDFYYFNKPDFSDPEACENYEFSGRARDLHAGRPIYMISKEDVEAGNLDNIYPVQDFHGNGNLTVLPKIEKKPNALQVFFHKVAKLFGGKGLEVCNNYDKYVSETARIRDEKKNTPELAFPERAKQVEKVNKHLFPDLDEKGREQYYKAVERTKELQKTQQKLIGNDKALNERCIAARLELMKMMRTPEKNLNAEEMKKQMSIVVAATSAYHKPVKPSELDNIAAAIRNTDIFKNATQDLKKADLADFLGGQKLKQMQTEYASRKPEPNVPTVGKAPVTKTVSQDPVVKNI